MAIAPNNSTVSTELCRISRNPMIDDAKSNQLVNKMKDGELNESAAKNIGLMNRHQYTWCKFYVSHTKKQVCSHKCNSCLAICSIFVVVVISALCYTVVQVMLKIHTTCLSQYSFV